MKKAFFLMVTALMLFTFPANASSGYSAIAVGVGGASFVSGYHTMETARNAAVANCRNAGYGSCSISVAERDFWYYSAGKCNGQPYAGASPQGRARAQQIVAIKGNADGNFNCFTFMTR